MQIRFQTISFMILIGYCEHVKSTAVVFKCVAAFMVSYTGNYDDKLWIFFSFFFIFMCKFAIFYEIIKMCLWFVELFYIMPWGASKFSCWLLMFASSFASFCCWEITENRFHLVMTSFLCEFLLFDWIVNLNWYYTRTFAIALFNS